MTGGGILGRVRAAIGRLLGGGEAESEGFPPGVEPAAMTLRELSDPRVIENDPHLGVACERCGEVFGDYWSWYNHLDDAPFSGFDEGREAAQVVAIKSPGRLA